MTTFTTEDREMAEREILCQIDASHKTSPNANDKPTAKPSSHHKMWNSISKPISQVQRDQE